MTGCNPFVMCANVVLPLAVPCPLPLEASHLIPGKPGGPEHPSGHGQHGQSPWPHSQCLEEQQVHMVMVKASSAQVAGTAKKQCLHHPSCCNLRPEDTAQARQLKASTCATVIPHDLSVLAADFSSCFSQAFPAVHSTSTECNHMITANLYWGTCGEITPDPLLLTLLKEDRQSERALSEDHMIFLHKPSATL